MKLKEEVGTAVPVAAVTPFSTLDWPGMLTATLFVPGCPWNCPYCHNKESLARAGLREWEEVVAFLQKRRRVLDGIVFSGGEPTLYSSLPWTVKFVRSLGYKAALHTGGPFPDALERLMEEAPPDWVGMDYKAPLARYPEITGDPVSPSTVPESLRILEESGVDFEIRTTLAPEVARWEAVYSMALELAGMGLRGRVWVLQQHRSGDIRNGFEVSPPIQLMMEWAERASKLSGLRCRVRSSDN